MNTRVSQVTFSSGELSPDMYGRVDAAQYRAGVAKMSNFVALPQGPARSRPGFQYVNRVNGGGSVDGPVKLISFVYSTGDSAVVELGSSSGSGYARFHVDGKPVTWCDVVELGVQSATTVVVANPGVFNFASPHKLQSNEQVRVGSTGTLPGGLSDLTTYYVKVVDGRKIQLSTAGGPGTGVEVTSVGNGTLRLYKVASMPPAYRSSISTSTTGTVVASATPSAAADSTILYNFTGHGFVNGDVVRHKGTTAAPVYWGGATNDYISTTRDLYVIEATANTFKLSFEEGGDPIAFDASVTPNTYQAGSGISLRYLAGKLYWMGENRPAGSPAVDLQSGRGIRCLSDNNGVIAGAGISGNLWETLDAGGDLKIASPYAQAHLFDLNTAQQNDVMTFANVNYVPNDLQRLSASEWRFVEVPIAPSIAAPAVSGVVPDYGTTIKSTSYGVGSGAEDFRFEAPHNLAPGDGVYCIESTGTGAGSFGAIVSAGTFYIVSRMGSTAWQEVRLRPADGGPEITGNAVVSGSYAKFSYTSLTSDKNQTYVATAVDADGVESDKSAEVSTVNQLSTRGASNTIYLESVSGADHYNVYKKENGLFGYIGRTDSTVFVDDNIAPDLGQTPPKQDESISGTNYPRCVSAFEERRVFAATSNDPQTVWASRTGTLSDFSYRIPVLSEDRIKLTLSSTDAQTVRHIIGLRDVLILTQSGEWRMRGTNDGGITPSSVFVRQEGFDGASTVSPALVNGQVVYATDRGNHLRSVGYSSANGGIQAFDLSLRAPHLFDSFVISDLSSVKSPYPIVWAVSSSKKLLGVTYIPDESVAGVHQHDTDGEFHSVAGVPEGVEDALYVTVTRKDSSGADVQTVERMQEFKDVSLDKTASLDSYTSTYSDAFDMGFTVRLRVRYVSRTLQVGETVSLEARDSSDAGTVSVFSSEDVGSEVRLFTSGTVSYRVKVSSYVDATKLEATILDELPTSLVSGSLAADRWAVAPTVFNVPTYLAGREVTVLADGVASTATVAADATVTLVSPALYVHIGLPYDCDLQTLPVALQVDGLGSGRTKNLNKAWVRTVDAYRLSAGPDTDNLEPVDPQSSTTSPTVTEGEQRTLLSPSWTDDGQIYVRQSSPYPATVVSMSLQIAIGD